MTERSKLTEMALVAAVSVIGTGAAAWFSFGKDTVSMDELQTYVSLASPYVRDAPMIALAQKNNTEAIADLRAAVADLVASNNIVAVNQARLMERYDMILSKSGSLQGSGK